MSPRTGRETWGIGEWYGRLLTELPMEERRRFAEIQAMPSSRRPEIACPFRSTDSEEVVCKKNHGVCSLRRYVETDEGALPVHDADGGLSATCPSRFEEGGLIYEWIGEMLLGFPDPVALGEIDFLEDPAGNKVGRIDNILVRADADGRLEWCALEKQAVYFSGGKMESEFRPLREATGSAIPFPAGRRRPDFRSSGPKRLMPQLQIKVPTLRRWGKKMAVVVDERFFAAMGEMRTVSDVSNGDIVWFVVGYEERDGRAGLARRAVAVTTLETSVEGLTGGEPVTKAAFEAEILRKLSRAAT